MKATETTQATKDFIEMTRHEGGVTYKCLKCGGTKEANAYCEADHEAWMDHVAKCKGNPQEPTQAQVQKPAAPNPPPALHNRHTEAPASFNVKARSPEGFDVMLTLRANDTGKLLGRIEKALAWLTAHKFTPTSTRNSGRRGNNDAGNGEAPSCPTHGKAMKSSQYGGWYCPVKIADDDGAGKAAYCKQKAK